MIPRVIELIKELQDLGYEVSYFKRKDGGYLITSINGESYRGAKGNERARQLTGTSLSTAQKLQRVNAQTRQYGGLTKEERSAYQSLKLTYSKRGAGEKISIQRFRELKATLGSERAISSARSQAHHKRGYAYEANVQYQIEVLTGLKNAYGSNELDKTISYLRRNISNIKDSDLYSAFTRAIYPMSQGAMSLTEGGRVLENIYNIK